MEVSNEIGTPKDILLCSLLNDDTFVSVNNDGESFDKSYAAFCCEIEKTTQARRWASLLHVLAISTLLDQNIISLFPDVPYVHRPLVHTIVKPLSDTAHASLGSLKHLVRNSKPLIILWTRDAQLDSTPGAIFQPNHVVPVTVGTFHSTECTRDNSPETTGAKGTAESPPEHPPNSPYKRAASDHGAQRIRAKHQKRLHWFFSNSKTMTTCTTATASLLMEEKVQTEPVAQKDSEINDTKDCDLPEVQTCTTTRSKKHTFITSTSSQNSESRKDQVNKRKQDKTKAKFKPEWKVLMIHKIS